MAKKGLKLLLPGIVIILVAYFFDLITGKGEIILGPKSYTALVMGTVMVLVGLLRLRKK